MADEASKKVDQLLSVLRDPTSTVNTPSLIESLSSDANFLNRLQLPFDGHNLEAISQQPRIKELIIKLSREQDIHSDRLLAKRKQIFELKQLKEFDIFMFQEMDRLILKQQEILCKAGLPFKPSLDLQELKRQKWSLSLLLNAIKN